MMRINILNKGDEVLSVTESFIAIKRKNGEVDLLPFLFESDGLVIDEKQIVTIGNVNSEVVVDNSSSVTIINF